MAFIRKLPDTPERLEHLKGGAGYLERYALLSPEEMLGVGVRGPGPERVQERGRLRENHVFEPTEAQPARGAG